MTQINTYEIGVGDKIRWSEGRRTEKRFGVYEGIVVAGGGLTGEARVQLTYVGGRSRMKIGETANTGFGGAQTVTLIAKRS